jgi:hypothetical protein
LTTRAALLGTAPFCEHKGVRGFDSCPITFKVVSASAALIAFSAGNGSAGKGLCEETGGTDLPAARQKTLRVAFAVRLAVTAELSATTVMSSSAGGDITTNARPPFEKLVVPSKAATSIVRGPPREKYRWIMTRLHNFRSSPICEHLPDLNRFRKDSIRAHDR